MSIHQIFVISRAGSLIYDWEAKNNNTVIEREYSYPLTFVLEEIDQKAVVVFGEKDGVKSRYYVSAVNNKDVSGTRLRIDDKDCNVIEYLNDESNFPLIVRFAPPAISTNEKIILSSMFHSLFTIAVQLSPVAKSTGIEVLETSQFKLNCLQTRTGVKFVVVTASAASVPTESVLNKIYELYTDFALKNPFYAIDMPIRCQKFDDAIAALLDRVEKSNGAVTI